MLGRSTSCTNKPTKAGLPNGQLTSRINPARDWSVGWKMKNVCGLRLCPAPAVAVARMPRTVPTCRLSNSIREPFCHSEANMATFSLLYFLECAFWSLDCTPARLWCISLPSSRVFAFSPPSQGQPLLLPPSRHLSSISIFILGLEGGRAASPDPLPDVRRFQLLALRRSLPRIMSSSMFVWLCLAVPVDHHPPVFRHRPSALDDCAIGRGPSHTLFPRHRFGIL